MEKYLADMYLADMTSKPVQITHFLSPLFVIAGIKKKNWLGPFISDMTHTLPVSGKVSCWFWNNM